MIAFPLQQCLHERASMLRYTQIACLMFVVCCVGSGLFKWLITHPEEPYIYIYIYWPSLFNKNYTKYCGGQIAAQGFVKGDEMSNSVKFTAAICSCKRMYSYGTIVAAI
jgi:hypothetical protein